MDRRLAFALAMFALLGAGSARGQETPAQQSMPEAAAAAPIPRISLRWSAPSECPDDAQVVAAVEGLLGQPLAEAREQQLAVNLSAQASGAGFTAKLEFTTPQGTQERFLEHPDCQKLMEATALVTALAIDPERVRARQEAAEAVDRAPAAAPPPPQPKPADTPALAASCPPAPPTPIAAPVKAASRMSFGLAGFVGAGVLPGFNAGFAAEAGARFERFHARLVGRYWLPGAADIQGGPLSIELSLASVGVHGCVVPRRDAWSLLGCLGLNFGDMSGSGQGVNHAHTRHALFGSLETSVLAAYTRLEPAPFAGLSLSWAVVRPPFGASLAGVETETFRPGQPALLAQFGVSYGL